MDGNLEKCYRELALFHLEKNEKKKENMKEQLRFIQS